MSNRKGGQYWLKNDNEWIVGYWDGHCWEDYGHFGLRDSDYDEVGPALLNPDDMLRLIALKQAELLEQLLTVGNGGNWSAAQLKAHANHLRQEAASYDCPA